LRGGVLNKKREERKGLVEPFAKEMQQSERGRRDWGGEEKIEVGDSTGGKVRVVVRMNNFARFLDF
jgi:hypothetical protein